MPLIAFNPADSKHQHALDHFLYAAEHPICQLEQVIEDIDLTFRCIATEEFELDPWISDDPDGCFIGILDPSDADLALIVCLGYLDDREEPQEVFLKATGKALFDTTTKMVVWDIDPQSLDLATPEEFEKAEKEKPNSTQ